MQHSRVHPCSRAALYVVTQWFDKTPEEREEYAKANGGVKSMMPRIIKTGYHVSSSGSAAGLSRHGSPPLTPLKRIHRLTLAALPAYRTTPPCLAGAEPHPFLHGRPGRSARVDHQGRHCSAR